MPELKKIPRAVLLAFAVVFAAATIFYTAAWMYYARWESRTAPIGIVFAEPASGDTLPIIQVTVGSAAERAGFKAGDRILRINGREMRNLDPYFDAVVRGNPGDRVEFVVESEGAPAPTVKTVTLDSAPAPNTTTSFTAAITRELANSYPLLFLIVGLYVLFVRIEDKHAWLLALLFAAFIAGPAYEKIRPVLHPAIREWAMAYAMTFAYMGPALFYGFFTTFPDSSPIERRMPWLKWVVAVLCGMVSLPAAASLLFQGRLYPFYVQAGWVSTGQFRSLALFVLIAFVLLGFAALVSNVFEEKDPQARRRFRVVLWGTVAGFGPEILRVTLASGGVAAAQLPWVQLATLALLTLLPASMAYAVLKYRVMEIPVLLKRTSRYFLVRGAYATMMLALTAFLPWLISRSTIFVVGADLQATLPVAIFVGVAFGMLWTVSTARVEKIVRPRIDRAFFRSVYDTQSVLQDLSEKAAQAASRSELAELLNRQICEALHPQSIAVYFAVEESGLRLESFHPGPVPDSLEILPVDMPLLRRAQAHGAALDVEEGPWYWGPLAPLEPECVVPLLNRHRQLNGLLVLGQRLSEEPYSSEDKELLRLVSQQAASALENIRLAEQMAARLQAEAKRANEMSIAREVQSKLFPQRKPPLATLDYAGSCDQARTIGGDYYDYLDLGKGRVGLVLADISGKGIFAALLMANLQANLRSQYAMALTDFAALMCSVNKLFFESVTPGLYATMFIADYSDENRRLRYINCGHNPPLVVRANGACDKLEPTATVVGLLDVWECTVGETTLAPGDTLVIYSDGVTEASSDSGEFFGDSRLEATIRQHKGLCAAELTKAIATTVHTFSGKEQEDDLTLLIARAK